MSKKKKNPQALKSGSGVGKRGQQRGMSTEMQNAMLLLFAGGMMVLAYVLYLSYGGSITN